MNTARILVVDDEPQIRRVMRTALTAAGYMVEDARSGEAALELVREQRYDLILLDSNLPGMSGVATCTQIRAGSEVPILMLTVRNSEFDKVEALDAGADDYIVKPFSMPELLARIRAHLRRSPASSEGRAIRFGEVVIELAARQVTVRGKAVRFTPKEFDLLEYLATNPHVAIPHTRLLQAIWGPDYGGQVEYLHVFINQIRKKIEPNPSRPRYLLTEPRVGYRFEYES